MRWSLAQSVPFAPRGYLDDADDADPVPELDADLVPASRPPQHGAAQLVRVAAATLNSGNVAALLATMSGAESGLGFTRAPRPGWDIRRGA